MPTRWNRFLVPALASTFALAALVLLPASAAAQPFGAWMVPNGTSGKYVEIASSPDLNPTSQITIEAWVTYNTATNPSCRSVIGKNYTQTYWIGICGSTLRSYLAGTSSLYDAGTIPPGQWTHIAVTYDGTNRLHYINGELVGTLPQTGTLPTNTANLRIASDVAYDFPPNGAINEVRMWNVARTIDQIRGSINVPIAAATTGLVAVWSDGMHDAVGGHTGTDVGALGFLTFPVTIGCTTTANSLCLEGRFAVSVGWRDFSGNTGLGTVVPGSTTDSGLFWFFSPTNWEVLTKMVNGCSLNNRWWAFGAATTNVFYRLEFGDVRAGANKIYFNYPGVASPAITDAAAFSTCP